MIVETVRIRPAPQRRADVLEIFQAIRGPVLAQPGCIACSIYEEQGPDEAVVLVGKWQTEAALRAHLRSESYRLVLGAIELSAGTPEVGFDFVSASAGMELIERSRTPGCEPGLNGTGDKS